MLRKTLLVLGVLGLALVPATASLAANAPGEACSKPGEVLPLGAGSVECVNGLWAPSSKQPAGTGSGAQQLTPTSPPTSPPRTPAASAAVAKIFKPAGVVESQATFGSASKQVADPSALLLPDGRIRLYSWVAPTGLRSATSTDSTGMKFVADPTIPLATMAGQPRVVRIDSTTVRLFFTGAGGVSAAISHDNGLTFSDEGVVLSHEQAGFEPGVITVIKQGKQYRAYFSNLEKPGVRVDRIMKTATSSDMMHWAVGPQLKMSGSHPFALIDAKGKVALYYSTDRGSSYGIFASSSTDGINFKNEKFIVAGGGDSDIVSVGKGKWIMYYGGNVSAADGFGILAARSMGNAVLR